MNEVIEREPLAATSPMAMMARAMERGSLTIEQMQALMDAQERIDKNEAKKQFVGAMTQFKSRPLDIYKNRRVNYANKSGGRTDYTHATLANVCSKIIAGLSEVGISHKWTPEQNGNRIKVTCVLTHAAGHSESTALEATADDSGGKNSIQAVGSTVTYLERYTLLAATGIAVKDQDDDGAAGALRKSAPGEIYRVEPKTVVVEGPTAKVAPAPVEAPSAPPPPPADARPMTEGQRKILAARMKNANLTDAQMTAKFGKPLASPSWLYTDFKEVQAWTQQK